MLQFWYSAEDGLDWGTLTQEVYPDQVTPVLCHPVGGQRKQNPAHFGVESSGL